MRYIDELPLEIGAADPVSLDYCPLKRSGKSRVNILALGDVGTTVLIGLRLLGGDVISSIGICDINKDNLARLEMEINQIRYPFEDGNKLPKVEIVKEDKLFDCDVFIFCASKGVPDLGTRGDVRMAQLDANRDIITHFGDLAKSADFKGLVAVVSDPVDPLCKTLLECSGLKPSQVQGYGLGVMNARALYFAEKDERFARYAVEGRVFGPHGEDLVIADSIDNYDDDLSRELTELAVKANLKVRELGYKPYIAPALSSAAISILLTMRKQWHYSSLYMGDGTIGAFLGIRNRITETGAEYENTGMCDQLYGRIARAYKNLSKL